MVFFCVCIIPEVRELRRPSPSLLCAIFLTRKTLDIHTHAQRAHTHTQLQSTPTPCADSCVYNIVTNMMSKKSGDINIIFFNFHHEKKKCCVLSCRPRRYDIHTRKKNLNIDGAPIPSRSHTHPSHSQTSHLLSSSLSLG